MTVCEKVDSIIYNEEHFKKNVLSDEALGKTITFLNPFSYQYFWSNPPAVSNFDYIYIDGSSLVITYNFFNKRKVDRVSFDFSSIAGAFFSNCIDKQYRVALIGGTEAENNRAQQVISEKYPDINIVFSRNGFFENKEDVELTIKSFRSADVFVLGMGTPHQEDFAIKVRSFCPNSLIITCGGFLTQTSIKPDYYYPVVKRLGIRWLQRAIMHDYVRRRLLNDYPKFFIKYVFKKLSSKD